MLINFFHNGGQLSVRCGLLGLFRLDGFQGGIWVFCIQLGGSGNGGRLLVCCHRFCQEDFVAVLGFYGDPGAFCRCVRLLGCCPGILLRILGGRLLGDAILGKLLLLLGARISILTAFLAFLFLGSLAFPVAVCFFSQLCPGDLGSILSGLGSLKSSVCQDNGYDLSAFLCG